MVEKFKEKRYEYQKIGQDILKNEEKDFLVGCALYWAEGEKRRNSTVFVNSDPNMIKFMISFFRKYFNIPNERFSIRFNCHLDNGLSYQDVENYWLNLLNLPQACVRKSTIKTNNTNRTVKYPYGVCSLSVLNGTETNQAIFGAIKEIANINKDSW